LVRTQVGDRYVVEYMRQHGFNIGGEQSGHIVLGDYGSTGDGLVAALQVLAVAIQSDAPVSKSCRPFEPLPQLLRNISIKGGQPLNDEDVKKSIASGEQKLSGTGRLLIRESGTEPLIRVMAEGVDEALVNVVVDDIVSAVERAAR
jgi:phosphoglucosamine mutase